MPHTDALQETSPPQLPHHSTSVLRLTHEQPRLASSPPHGADPPLHQYHPPPKHVINTTGLPLHAHSPRLLHAGLHMPNGPLVNRQHAVQAINHTEKDCSDNNIDVLHQISVPVRPLCRITNPTSRQVTFSKRRNGLLKKAYELSVLCDVEVGVIIFSATGRRSEFASCSTSMEKLLERYQKHSNGLPTQENLFQEVEFWRRQVFLLREQISHQKDLQSYMLGENLLSLDLNDIETVEHKINIAINKVRVQKAQLIQAKAQESILREARLKEENGVLKRKIYEVTNLHALKERMLVRNEAPMAPYLGGDVTRPSMHESSPLVGEDKCPSASRSTFISQDMSNPLKLQLGLELFPTCKPAG